MADGESPDRPWTEAQWERFLLRSDLRARRYGDLLETLRDHPDRDAVIEREMGWDRHVRGEMIDAAASAVWSGAAADAEDASGDADPVDEQESLAQVEAFEWGMRLYGLRRELGAGAVAGWTEADRETIDGLFQATSAAARLAGAAAMGVDDDALCGNIVCCRQARGFVDEALATLRELVRRGIVPAGRGESLIHEGEHVRHVITGHVERLRARVWWDDDAK